MTSELIKLPEALREQFEGVEVLPILGPAHQFLVRPQQPQGELQRVYYLPHQSAEGEAAGPDLREAAWEYQGLVHPHLCRVEGGGGDQTGVWSAESGGGQVPLAAWWRESDCTTARRLTEARELWEALAYVHLGGLSHGCLCPGVLWAGEGGACLGGLAGVGALARLQGRDLALGTTGAEPSVAEQWREAWQRDGHDLAVVMAGLAEWPEPVEQLWQQIRAQPLPAGEVARRIGELTAQRMANCRPEPQWPRGAVSGPDEPRDGRRRGGRKRQAEATTKMVRTTCGRDGWRQTAGALIWGLGSLIVILAVLTGLTAGVIISVFGPTGEPTRVPEVAGMEMAEARARLESAGLQGVVGREVHDGEVAQGQVMGSMPYGGKLVRAGREVELIVSLGPREIKVPKLTGLTLELAKEKLTTAELTLGPVATRSSKAETDEVLKQDPEAGSLMGRNGEVQVVVSGGPDYGIVKGSGGVTYVFRQLKLVVPQGQALQLVKVNVSGRGRDDSFYERLCGPGEVVEVDLMGRRDDRVQVTIEGEQVFSERL